MLQHSIILFDGICNLCNQAVIFVIKRDSKNHFNFASLQSAEGRKTLQKHKLQTENFNSFILIERDKIYTRSTAALKVAVKLNGFWPLLYAFIFIPKIIRDSIYDLVAANRYKWFGKKDVCMIPTQQLKERFLN